MKKIVSILAAFMMFVSVSSANSIIHTVEPLSANGVWKVKLEWTSPSEDAIQITGYNRVGEGAVEVGYRSGKDVPNLSEVTIYIEGMDVKPIIMLRNKGREELKFTDLPGNSEIIDAIKVLNEKEIIKGYPDGTFKPDKSVSREEFAKMLTVAAQFRVQENLTSRFTDLPNSQWSKNYVMTLVNKGILTGRTYTEFAPSGKITLGELLTILNRTYKIEASYNGVVKTTNHWSKDNFTKMVKAGILKTDDSLYTNLNLDKALTRAECSLLLARVFDTNYEVR
ncbi:MAG: S-layer homology domain-containing protein [Clostridia bacterium]|jgi:hypothetical protein|nr:S-layer homology domain-containing protein [Clostridia bacterium]